ncbi:thioredoxin family protein [Winogradskyella haliclonae]|uniref:Thioredoxin n=1 Tax=Winogradskyella haliclonae TaxID=2048558 RepID=A0ABQ2BV64_9FLAO|nr:thioredoxin fold domain-containing protein [Winogradskyella haliclonae]GGI56389.1 thioredoxin [Winogradskyella haliclonae]
MKFLATIGFIALLNVCSAQTATINWLSFEELEVALTHNPKPVIIDFYADWCAYCKKMDQAVYSKPEVIALLNANYYAVKFNAESRVQVQFGGKIFKNRNLGKKRRAFHEITELLAAQPNQPMTLPAIVFFDKNFNITQRYFEYIPPKKMLSILKNN